jgi:hypothetical protein
MTTTTATYLSIANNLAKQQAVTAADPTVKTASAYYAAHIGKVTSISQFVGNYRLLSYALDAYGLGDQINSTALIKQVLQGGVTNPKSLANTLPKWKAFAEAFAFIGKDPTTATSYYAANIGSVTSISDFVGNTKLLTYALDAYGLGDQASNTKLITQVLQGGVSNPTSLANTQTKWKAFATAFDFVGKGAASVSTSAAIAAAEKNYVAQMSAAGPTAVAATEKNYVEQQLENNEGQQDVGVQLALYFNRVAPSVTSMYGILADKNLLEVVETIFGLPSSFSAASVDTQSKELGALFKVSDLQSPKKLKQLTERFTAQYDSLYGPAGTATGSLTVSGNSSTTSSSSSAASGALAVLSGIVSSNPSTGAVGFSNALLQSLQGFKVGG